jgi:hypothetical protein
LCGKEGVSLDDLVGHTFITKYSSVPESALYKWLMIDSEYERFKYARSFLSNFVTPL